MTTYKVTYYSHTREIIATETIEANFKNTVLQEVLTKTIHDRIPFYEVTCNGAIVTFDIRDSLAIIDKIMRNIKMITNNNK